MKKILALLLAVVMVLGLVACASKDTPAAETTTDEPAATETKTEETTTEEPADEETTEEPAAETGAVIAKVALVTDVGTIDDESFNQATYISNPLSLATSSMISNASFRHFLCQSSCDLLRMSVRLSALSVSLAYVNALASSMVIFDYLLYLHPTS